MCPGGMESFNGDATWFNEDDGTTNNCGETWNYCSANLAVCNWDQLDESALQAWFAPTPCCGGSDGGKV